VSAGSASYQPSISISGSTKADTLPAQLKTNAQKHLIFRFYLSDKYVDGGGIKGLFTFEVNRKIGYEY
jgi:hypothetical protein